MVIVINAGAEPNKQCPNWEELNGCRMVGGGWVGHGVSQPAWPLALPPVSHKLGIVEPNGMVMKVRPWQNVED